MDPDRETISSCMLKKASYLWIFLMERFPKLSRVIYPKYLSHLLPGFLMFEIP
jgi:hypothetical protein